MPFRLEVMKIAIAQISSKSDKLENLALVEDYVARAAKQGAELVVFPEATMRGFGTERLDTCAETAEGAFVQRLRALAQQHHIAIVAGVFFTADLQQQEDKEIQRVANVAVAVLPDAVSDATLITYHKIHTFDAFGFRESDTVRPGKQLVTFEFGGITFGLAICYDVRFPELFRQLALQGAQVIILPASWGTGAGKLAQWQLLTQARALDSGSYLVACDQAEATDPRKSGAPTGVGGSAFINPWGQRVAELGAEPGLLCCEVDASISQEVREQLGVLSHDEDYREVQRRHFQRG